MPDSAVEEIAGKNGLKIIADLWVRTGDEMYHSPYFALRQEWFHYANPFRRKPAFFDRLHCDSIVLDWGCGTAELDRIDWIDRGGKIILADVPGPNFEYTKHKYDGFNVEFRSVYDPIDYNYDALVCMDVLEHIPNPMEVMLKLWDGLNPCGQALLWFESGFPHPGHLFESVKQVSKYDEWLYKNTDVVSRYVCDWVRKPKSKSRRFYEFVGFGQKKAKESHSARNKQAESFDRSSWLPWGYP